MTNPNRNDSLKQLQDELTRVETDDEATKTTIRSMAVDVQKLIDEEATGDHKSVLDQLNAAITQFEGKHPTVALAITQAINALVDGGV
jgi:Domain of unknown function (DUF4404)